MLFRHSLAHGRGVLRALGATLFLLAVPLARPAAADSVVTTWDEATLQSIRDTKPGPTLVARYLAVVHTCTYEAWAAYDAKAVGTRLGGTLRRPPAERTLANKNEAVSYAAYRALVDLFPQPQEVASATALMTSLGFDPNNTSTEPTTPAGIGNLAAQAVLDFRHHDGSNQLGDLHPGPYTDYTGYTPVNDPDHINDPDRWQPLRVSDGHGGTVVQKYTTPFWGLVTPFALESISMFRPVPCALYGQARYVKQVQQLLFFSSHLTDRRKMIAEYWADGPNSEFPPGHWALFAQFVSHRDLYAIDQDAKLFFALANAELDAGIGCWETKRFYDSVRPITAIHFLYIGRKIRAWGGVGQGTKIINGEDWTTYGQAATVITPPFPEYTSGHSTFSAAGAEILKSFTGSPRFGFSRIARKGSSVIEPGLTPHQDLRFVYPTFKDAADEAGWSRRYGGIHFEDGDLNGRRMGQKIGALAWKKALTYFNGTAATP